MTQQERELLRSFRALPQKRRNELARRILVESLIHREPADADPDFGEEGQVPNTSASRGACGRVTQSWSSNQPTQKP